MSKGGCQIGAGRPKGSTDKRPNALKVRIAQRMEESISPVEFMLNVLHAPDVTKMDGETEADFLRRQKEQLTIKLDVAAKVAPYVHPKLANVETKQDDDQFERQAKNLDVNEVARRIAFLMLEAKRKESSHAEWNKGGEGREETQEGIRLQ